MRVCTDDVIVACASVLYYTVTSLHVRTERDHASVIGNFLDRDVGRVIQTLDDLGLSDNTLLVFASGTTPTFPPTSL